MTARLGNLLFAIALSLAVPCVRAAEADADRIRLAVEALTRLEGINLDANPTMKERVLKVLALSKQQNLTEEETGRRVMESVHG